MAGMRGSNERRGGYAPGSTSGIPPRRSPLLRQCGLDRLAAFWRQRDRPRADVVVLLRVDADRLEDRRGHVAGADLAVGDRLAVGVSLAVDGAALDAAAGQRARPRAGEVVAADVLVDLRRPPELAQRHHER